MEATNILIADAQVATRFGLIIPVREVVFPVQIYLAWSPEGVISMLQQHDIDLVIYDVAMSGMDDLGFIKQWRDIRPMVSSLVGIQEAVLSMLSQDWFVSAAVQDMIVKKAVDPAVEL